MVAWDLAMLRTTMMKKAFWMAVVLRLWPRSFVDMWDTGWWGRFGFLLLVLERHPRNATS